MQPRFLNHENHPMDDFAQYLGFCGIVGKSFSILRYDTKTFFQISLAILLPLGIIYQIIAVLSLVLVALPSEGSPFIGICVLTVIFLLAIVSLITLSLLAVAAVVTAVAQTYLQIPLHFPLIIRRAPRILKKLFVTSLWGFLLLVAYNVAFLLLPVLVLVFLPGSTLGSVILAGLLVFYVVGSLYISIVVDFANVVTVLEEGYGRAAIVRSRNLLRGKEIVTWLIMIVGLLFYVIILVGLSFVEYGGSDNAFVRVVAGMAYSVVAMVVSLLVDVIYTVLYITCKFYHKEAIDGSRLASHLDAYFGPYITWKLEDSHV